MLKAMRSPLDGGRIDRTVSIWDFSDVENPRLVRWFTLPCATEAASFWRDTLVIPARLQGVLIGK